MSTYTKITKHPQTGDYELATWHDDYFGPHIYGVEFSSDEKVYPTELVDSKQIYDFWADDVINAFRNFLEFKTRDLENAAIIKFLNAIQHEYRSRWQEDPLTGNGATEKSKIVKKK